MNSVITPSALTLHRKSGLLELTFREHGNFKLSAEFLRVHSPSAEVRGHGRGQEVLQTGKKHVGITALEPVGNYGIKLLFDDGHDTGIFSWDYLLDLCINYDSLWNQYLERLRTTGNSREALPPGTQIVNIVHLDSDKAPEEK